MTPRVLRSALVLVVSVFLVSHIFPGGLSSSSLPPSARAAPTSIQYSQPPRSDMGLLFSSAAPPTIGDGKGIVWDDFTLDRSTAITGLRWMGAYAQPADPRAASVWQFLVAIYPSDASGARPDLNRPLARIEHRGRAGEKLSPLAPDRALYTYALALPAPLAIEGGMKYWLGIEAIQRAGAPQWGWLRGSGNGGHLRNEGNGKWTEVVGEDASFELVGLREG